MQIKKFFFLFFLIFSTVFGNSGLKDFNDWIDFVDLLDLASENNRMLKIIFPHSVSKIRFLLSPNAGMNYLNGRIKINSIELFMDN